MRNNTLKTLYKHIYIYFFLQNFSQTFQVRAYFFLSCLKLSENKFIKSYFFAIFLLVLFH